MKHTKVCEFHFRPEEIKVSSRCGKKILKSWTEVPFFHSRHHKISYLENLHGKSRNIQSLQLILNFFSEIVVEPFLFN